MGVLPTRDKNRAITSSLRQGFLQLSGPSKIDLVKFIVNCSRALTPTAYAWLTLYKCEEWLRLSQSVLAPHPRKPGYELKSRYIVS